MNQDERTEMQRIYRQEASDAIAFAQAVMKARYDHSHQALELRPG